MTSFAITDFFDVESRTGFMVSITITDFFDHQHFRTRGDLVSALVSINSMLKISRMRKYTSRKDK